MCLDKLNKKPAKILEIGTSRSLNGKAGDGWSTLFWCEYVAQYGGELNVCDVDQAAINVSKLLTENYHSSINVNFFCEDGIKYIDNTYDLIFLDGSDCPYQMLEQFEKIDRTKTIILCDDFHVKGTVVREKYKDFKLIKVNEIHEMTIYNKI
jgi:predicted O-methyltransferase YrrM